MLQGAFLQAKDRERYPRRKRPTLLQPFFLHG
jgi:hypothetical protein